MKNQKTIAKEKLTPYELLTLVQAEYSQIQHADARAGFIRGILVMNIDCATPILARWALSESKTEIDRPVPKAFCYSEGD